MIKLIVAIHRLPGMSPEAFHRHWRTQHAELVRSNPATRKYVRRYVQCHTTPSSYLQGDVAFDGTAELWFNDTADRDAFFSDPDYLTHIQPDEGRFADMSRTVFFETEEELVFGTPVG